MDPFAPNHMANGANGSSNNVDTAAQSSSSLSSPCPSATMFDRLYKHIFCDDELRQMLQTTQPVDDKLANSVQTAIEQLPKQPLGHFYPPIVVSYSTEHRDVDAKNAGPGYVVVGCLIRYLFENGMYCYTDMMTPVGCRWTEEFMNRVDSRSAKAMIVVLSPRYFWSVHCLNEICGAIERKLKIIPVMLQEHSLREEDMWRIEDLEKYANPNNCLEIKLDLEAKRLKAINALKGIKTVPSRGTLLGDPEVLDNLMRQLQHLAQPNSQVQHPLSPHGPMSPVVPVARRVVDDSCLKVVGYKFKKFVDCEEGNNREVASCLDGLVASVQQFLRRHGDKKPIKHVTAEPMKRNGKTVQVIRFEVGDMIQEMKDIERQFKAVECFLGELATMVRASDNEIEMFRLMAVLEGSLIVMMEAPSSFFSKIHEKFQAGGNQIVLENGVHVEGIAQAFVVTIPCDMWPNDLEELCSALSGEAAYDLISIQKPHFSLLVPTANEAFNKLMSNGVNSWRNPNHDAWNCFPTVAPLIGGPRGGVPIVTDLLPATKDRRMASLGTNHIFNETVPSDETAQGDPDGPSTQRVMPFAADEVNPGAVDNAPAQKASIGQGSDRHPPPQLSIQMEAPVVGPNGRNANMELQKQLARPNGAVIFTRRTLIIIAVTFIIGLVIGLVLAVLAEPSPTTTSPAMISSTAPAMPTSPTFSTSPVNTESPSASPTADVGSVTLSRILERGSLICAVTAQYCYNYINSDTGNREGFEVDLARAINAAIFGSDVPVNFTDVPFGDRFRVLNSSEVDLVIASASVTMQRDVFEPSTGTGFTFSTPYLYNGLRFAGVPEFVDCADQLNFNETCAEVKVCVLAGTTHVDVVSQLSDGEDVDVPGALDLETFYDYFMNGTCNVLAGEETEVSEAAVRRAGYHGEYSVGTNVFSKEPLAIVTRDGDPYFSDFVNWILQSLLAAEEQGITQATASSFPKSNAFGPDFHNMFVNAINAVGNYGEIYQRHLQAVVPRKPINTINKGDSGLIYSLPFGTSDGTGPGPLAGGTLQKILRRGFLRCGVLRGGFVGFNYTTQTGACFDVDYCRALSAAIFSGDSTRVLFRNQPATERFKALASGDVDVLSRITTVNLNRDVLEPTSMVGFSFSQPNFYEGLSFGGIPSYVQCADSLDTVSQECKDIKICVIEGTTCIEHVRQKFREKYIVAKDTGELALQGLTNGECQVVAGGSVHDISRRSVEAVGGYHGKYQIGAKRHSKEPLALVTRQDDAQWTSFVNWVVSATFYAEEQGITRSTSSEMPITNLFGVVNNRMLQDAIRAVGSYKEIYERNVAILDGRGGLNLPNANPHGPQHYAMPGF